MSHPNLAFAYKKQIAGAGITVTAPTGGYLVLIAIADAALTAVDMTFETVSSNSAFTLLAYTYPLWGVKNATIGAGTVAVYFMMN
jgi:2-keto-3-deoxy-6-phosphogluconate aldolase